MDDLYQEQILDHWRNSTHRGQLATPDATAEGMSPLCGDRIRVDVQIQDGRIATMHFSGEGCVISQASASMLAELVEGRTVEEARTFDRGVLLEELGVPLSPARLKCALLALSVLRQALNELPQASA